MRRASFLLVFLTLPLAAIAGPIGPDDFRVSHAGGDEVFDASSPSLIYNPDAGEYLAVWQGNDDSIEGMSPIHFENWGQLLWPDLSPRGDRFRISFTGDDALPDSRVGLPQVSYNPDAGEYLVVWSGPLPNDEIEILGQRIEATTGALLGGNLRLTQHGPDGNFGREAYSPRIAYGTEQREWMLVYSGDITTNPFLDDEFEILAQRFDAQAVAVAPAVQISETGPIWTPETDARNPNVVYNPTVNEFFVAFVADPNDDEHEIYGQRLDAVTGTEVGPDDFWISDSTTAGNDGSPRIAYNGPQEEYLVLWSSDADAVEGYEIYAQRLIASTGASVGANDFRISLVGPPGDPATSSLFGLSLTFAPSEQRYLVAWGGRESTSTGYEIYAQLLSSTGAEIGPPKIRVSTTGPEGESAYVAKSCSVAAQGNAFAVVWVGDSDEGESLQNEFEVRGQLLSGSTGAKINDERQISLMGTKDGYAAYVSEVVYNPVANEYLVAWLADGEKHGLEYGHFGLFVRRFDAATGAPLDAADRRIDSGILASDRPAVAFNPAANEYMVVWAAGYSPMSLVGQRLDADTLVEMGANDFVIVEPDENDPKTARNPAIAYCEGSGVYLLAWENDNDIIGLPGREVHTNRLDAIGNLLSPTAVVISANLVTGFLYTWNPQIAYNPATDEALVVWAGYSSTFAFSSVLGTRLDAATGQPVETSPRFVSDYLTNPPVYHSSPAIAFNPNQQEYLVVWHGNVQLGGIDNQIHGQRLDAQGMEIGANDFAITQNFTRANLPSVAFSPAEQQYFVTWEAHITGVGKQIHGEFLDRWAAPTDGSFELSHAPFAGLSEVGVTRSRVVHASGAGNYLTVWDGKTEQPSPFETDGREIRGQLVESDTATAAPLPLSGPALPRLSRVHPNPFSGRAQLFLELDRREDVTVEVFDARGRRVATLFEGPMSEAQPHALTLKGRDLANGVYWVRAKVGDWVGTQKAAVLR